MTTSIARSVSLRRASRTSWRTRQNARYRNEKVTDGCSPRRSPRVKVLITADGWHSRHPHAGLLALVGRAGLGIAAALMVFVGNPFSRAASVRLHMRAG